MVRHLIYYREARVIDVPRIQNYYAISPLFDLANLSGLSTSWSIKFPTLPSLVAFLAKLSSALKPFSVQCRKDERVLCLDALIWLLRHQVVVQMHVRLRLIAREEAKRQAAELRKAERERIQAQQQKRLAKRREAERRRQAEEVAEEQSTAQSSALSLSAPANVVPAGEATERGRHRDRSASPLTTGASREHSEDHTVASVLGASRPESTLGSPKSAAPIVPPSAPSSVPNVSSLADKVEELKFERRPVLRSRSPSRILAAASERSLSTRGSGSRPSTPRGRGRLAGHSRDSSTSLVVEVLQQGMQKQQPQSAPSAAIKSRSSRREARASNSSRSPSRARMRVTGFGEGEEVYVEIEGEGGGAKEPLQSSSTLDEGRRLSRVGEETEADTNVLLSGKMGTPAPTSEHNSREGEIDESDPGSDLEEEAEEEAVEIEEWETNPKATIITEPSRAGGEENEWIAVMVQGRPPWLTQRLFKWVLYHYHK
jgi:hypothetical protein